MAPPTEEKPSVGWRNGCLDAICTAIRNESGTTTPAHGRIDAGGFSLKEADVLEELRTLTQQAA